MRPRCWLPRRRRRLEHNQCHGSPRGIVPQVHQPGHRGGGTLFFPTGGRLRIPLDCFERSRSERAPVLWLDLGCYRPRCPASNAVKHGSTRRTLGILNAFQPDHKRPLAHLSRRCISRYSQREDRRSPSLGWISAVTALIGSLALRRWQLQAAW
jgi:hypothetical protein